MAPHSSTLAWKIPWMEEPGRLQSMGSLRVGHHCATSLSLFTFMHWRRKWQPTPVFLPGESQGRRAWWATVYGVAQSWTRLKRLGSGSSSSSSEFANSEFIKLPLAPVWASAKGESCLPRGCCVDSMRKHRNFPGDLVVRTPCFYCRGYEFRSWARN